MGHKVRKFSGKKVREAREAMGLTQRALGDIIRVTDGSIWSWESGKTFPSALNLFPLADALGRNVDWFFEDIDAES